MSVECVRACRAIKAHQTAESARRRGIIEDMNAERVKINDQIESKPIIISSMSLYMQCVFIYSHVVRAPVGFCVGPICMYRSIFKETFS